MRCTPRKKKRKKIFGGNEIYFYFIFGGPVGKEGGEKREKRDGIYLYLIHMYILRENRQDRVMGGLFFLFLLSTDQDGTDDGGRFLGIE